MLTNFILASLLIGFAILILIGIDSTTSLIASLIKQVFKWTHRSKLLTEYILRAYMRYRKTINKPLLYHS